MSAAALLLAASLPAYAADDACRRVLHQRIEACAQQCIANAKAAVDPEIRDRIKGYACYQNCAKLEMFNGHTCP